MKNLTIKTQKASAFARQIIKEFAINQPSEIDIESIAFLKGILIDEKDLIGSDARLIRINDRGIISVNKKIREKGQKRFCVAHEIGHFLLHKENNQFSNCTKEMFYAYQYLPDEQEANIFAAELLMPRSIFWNCCPKCEPSYQDVISLADSFKTSLTATLYRYVELNIYSCALIYSKNGLIQWYKKSEDFPYKLYEPKSKVNIYSGAGEFFNGNLKDAECELVQPDFWIEDRVESRSKLKELTIPLTYYNSTLSLIWLT